MQIQMVLGGGHGEFLRLEEDLGCDLVAAWGEAGHGEGFAVFKWDIQLSEVRWVERFDANAGGGGNAYSANAERRECRGGKEDWFFLAADDDRLFDEGMEAEIGFLESA